MAFARYGVTLLQYWLSCTVLHSIQPILKSSKFVCLSLWVHWCTRKRYNYDCTTQHWSRFNIWQQNIAGLEFPSADAKKKATNTLQIHCRAVFLAKHYWIIHPLMLHSWFCAVLFCYKYDNIIELFISWCCTGPNETTLWSILFNNSFFDAATNKKKWSTFPNKTVSWSLNHLVYRYQSCSWMNYKYLNLCLVVTLVTNLVI